MRKIGSLLLFASWMLCSTLAVGQKADDIIGAWKTGEGTAIVAVKKSKSGKYFGRIVWLKEPNDESGKPKVDGKNPNESKRDRRILGMVNLVGFEYIGDGKWEKGTIYDPKNGETYNCEIALEGENTLNVRGYIGVSLFGRTDVWTRQKKKG